MLAVAQHPPRSTGAYALEIYHSGKLGRNHEPKASVLNAHSAVNSPIAAVSNVAKRRTKIYAVVEFFSGALKLQEWTSYRRQIKSSPASHIGKCPQNHHPLITPSLPDSGDSTNELKFDIDGAFCVVQPRLQEIVPFKPEHLFFLARASRWHQAPLVSTGTIQQEECIKMPLHYELTLFCYLLWK